MPKKGIVVPEKFEDYTIAELRDIAENEFAVEAEGLNQAEVIAALLESGVTFDQHLDNHPEFSAVEDVKTEAAEEHTAPGVVTSEQMRGTADDAPVEEVKIVVKEATPLHTREEWLIKMDRPNPLYEVRGHRFTQENPYALVTPEDAEYLLTKETGFRQATPIELQQYYG